MCAMYHGGKNRIGKKIAEIIYNESLDIEQEYNFDIKGYCEPFCGMLGVFRYMPYLFNNSKIKYKAGDTSKSVIEMWKAAQKGWKPPNKKVNRKEYDVLKHSSLSSPKKGFVGHMSAYRAVYFGGFNTAITDQRYANASDSIQEIALDLKKVSFKTGMYTQYSNLKGYVIYCDPPYEGTQQRYKIESTTKPLHFDSYKFWEWCDKMAKHNIIFISSYKLPKKNVRPVGIEKIWSNEKEKLFLLY